MQLQARVSVLMLVRVDTKPNNASFRQNFTHPALKVLTGDSLPATFCLVYVKFMLENLHIILVSTLPNCEKAEAPLRLQYAKAGYGRR